MTPRAMAIAEVRGRAVAEAAATRIAADLRAVPGLRIVQDGGDVIVTGRGVMARRVGEPDLRWPAEALR